MRSLYNTTVITQLFITTIPQPASDPDLDSDVNAIPFVLSLTQRQM